jgi:dihydroxyacetone kinase-like protein
MDSIDRALIRAWLLRAASVFDAQKAYLTELDAPIGDSDHGENMARGFRAVAAKLDGWWDADIAAVLKGVAMTLISTVGGASGPLYGTLFLQAAGPAAGRASLDLPAWTACLQAGVAGVRARGRAGPGDKTMVDALLPAVAALEEFPDTELQEALARSASAAEEAAVATIPLLARKGRASYLGERSIGHQDPGATSVGLLLRALADAAA